MELIHLILHQRDERRYNKGDSRKHQSRYLITDGFPPAGGHDGQGISFLQNTGDDLFLQ